MNKTNYSGKPSLTKFTLFGSIYYSTTKKINPNNHLYVFSSSIYFNLLNTPSVPLDLLHLLKGVVPPNCYSYSFTYMDMSTQHFMTFSPHTEHSSEPNMPFTQIFFLSIKVNKLLSKRFIQIDKPYMQQKL